ncbi:MAG: acyltransferase [Anaerolineae bacterium]|nr:acyltransferase [Anaerolineae bacterium]
MLTNTIDTPWKTANHVRRLLAYPSIRIRFAWHGLAWGRGWRIFGMPIIQRHRHSTMQLGDYLELRSWMTTNPLAPYHPVVLSTRQAGACLTIGRHCGLTGVTVVAAERVDIGSRVLLGANTVITDTDFHPLTPWERQQDILNGRHAPVVIEDDVFVGMNSLILKGVRLGQGCVVGAGSVVAKDVPPGVIVAGNPARRVGRATRLPEHVRQNGLLLKNGK